MKCVIVGNALEEGLITPLMPMYHSGVTVAIVGIEPARLAVANELNQMGKKVTVFEHADHVGGLLMYGIPNMKLERDTVDRRISILQEEGIELAINADIGKNVNVNELQSRFDVLALCLGSTKLQDLPVNGCKLKGVYFAMVSHNFKRIVINS